MQIFANIRTRFAKICNAICNKDAKICKAICENVQHDLQKYAKICENMQASEQEEMGVPCKNLRTYVSQEIQGTGSPTTKFTKAITQGVRDSTTISAIICGQTIPEYNLLKTRRRRARPTRRRRSPQRTRRKIPRRARRSRRPPPPRPAPPRAAAAAGTPPPPRRARGRTWWSRRRPAWCAPGTAT